jgi:hypothetical protein
MDEWVCIKSTMFAHKGDVVNIRKVVIIDSYFILDNFGKAIDIIDERQLMIHFVPLCEWREQQMKIILDD